jgi:hypothetical protein
VSRLRLALALAAVLLAAAFVRRRRRASVARVELGLAGGEAVHMRLDDEHALALRAAAGGVLRDWSSSPAVGR